MGISNFTLTEVLTKIKANKIDLQEVYECCKKYLDESKLLNYYITYPLEEKVISRINLKQKHVNDPTTVNELSGIPYGAKDNFCTQDLKTTCASKMLSNYTPTYNATVIDKIQGAGAILMGKTNMDEFSMGSTNVTSFFGPAKNAWKDIAMKNILPTNNTKNSNDVDDFNIAGGSSGGSAVAVSTGSAFVSLGSDTGGSIRNPAAYCGVVGFKPTYGSVSRFGMIPLANSFDTPGVFARCVKDATLIYNYISGQDAKDLTTSPKSTKVSMSLFDHPDSSLPFTDQGREIIIKIGIPQQYLAVPDLEKEVREACTTLAHRLQNYAPSPIDSTHLIPTNMLALNRGAPTNGITSPSKSLSKVRFDVRVVEDMPHFELGLPCYTILTACDIASNMARFDGIRYGIKGATLIDTRMDGFNDVVKGRILAGNYFLSQKNREQFFGRAAKVRRLILEDFNSTYRPFPRFLSDELGFNPSCSRVDCWPNDGDDAVDLLLSPVTLSTAPRHSEYETFTRQKLLNQDILTVHANLAGIPAISVPVKLSERENMPIGLQLMGPHFSEPLLLYVAKVIEEIRGHFPTLKTA